METNPFNRLRNLPRYLRRKNMAWTESYKFWMETLRAVGLGVVGAILAVVFLRPTEQRVDFSGEVESTKLKMRADAITEFETASYLYTAAANSACKSPDR